MSQKLPPRHLLSKSTFMRGCQCVKSLWLHKFQPEVRDSISAQQANIFSMGTIVGELARQLFPGGVDASPATPYEYQQSVSDTSAYIAAGHKIIYEAAFQFDGILAALDILVKIKGKWYGFEVKSSTQVKDQYIDDVALQYYVITNSGIDLCDIRLVHINNNYIRKGDLNIKELFCNVSLKKEVKDKQLMIKGKALQLKAVIASNKIPEIYPGAQCSKPYPCDFYTYCSKDMEEILRDEFTNIDRNELKAFTKQLRYPLSFMDFETYMLAVPEYDGHWPYRQVPFQFSVHTQQKRNAELKHHSFLAPSDCDPCQKFVEKLIAAVGEKGSILVYNLTFENTRLKELKKDYPEYAKQIEKIQSRLVDLMTPFRKKHFYLPSMNGSYSIKAVLPALVPELSYAELKIGNGGDASAAFYNLRFQDDMCKVDETREALLKYCELDTLAMAKILERLYEETDAKVVRLPEGLC